MAELLNAAESTRDLLSAAPAALDRIHKIFIESMPVNTGADLSYEQRLVEAAEIDSVAVLEFIIAVEKEFGIELEPGCLDFDFLRDLPALASYLEDRLKGEPGSRP